MMLRSFSFNFDMNARGLAAMGPEPPFRKAARNLPLTCCTLLLEIPVCANGKL